MDLLKLKISELQKNLVEKKLSSKELSEFYLKRIAEHNPKLNAVLVNNENLLQEAEASDRLRAEGKNLGALHGIPLGIKDMFCTKGLRTTAGSKILENFVAPYDATVIRNLKQAGGLVISKLNQDEFAMGSSNENSFFGAVKNPWNTEYVPGGSSGGSAAAVAAGFSTASLGTDTGGSIRQPASFCGVVGIKPTYGRISRYGIIAFASSLDQAGPITNYVEDAALMLEVMSGRDPHDATSSNLAVPTWSKNLSADMKGKRIGVLKEYMIDGMDADTSKTVQKALDALKKAGAEIVEVSVPLAPESIPVYYLIATSEASSNLARYDGVKYGYRAKFKNNTPANLDEFYSKTRGEGFGPEVKRRILIGTFCLSSGYYDAYYSKACQVRRLLTNQFTEAFKNCDAIVSANTATPAFKLGARVADPLAMYLNDILTVSTNLAGLPGMSVPFGMSGNGLPIGIQITGKHFDEQNILNVGLALENVSEVRGRRPL